MRGVQQSVTMQRIFLIIALLLVQWVLAQSTVFAAGTVFVNVNVLPMTSETVIEQQTVVVEDGRIVAIGPTDEVPIPGNARLVDGTDRYLMPGSRRCTHMCPAAILPAWIGISVCMLPTA